MSAPLPRILFVTGEYPPITGGVGDYCARLRDALETLGVHVSVLTRTGAESADVHAVSAWNWRTRWAAAVVAARPDLVHIQYQSGAFAMHPVINLLPPRVARRFGLPAITTFHDLRPPYLFPKAGRLRGALMRQLARRSAACIVTNMADERALDARGVRSWRIPIGPNLPPPTACPQLQDPRTVAFFGFPARSKGVIELVAALGEIKAARRPDLMLIGAPGQPSRHNDQLAEAEIDTLAAAAGVRVERTGFLTPQDASNALAGAGVIVLPFRDGASLRSGSLLAALQSGRPVITTAPARSNDLEPLGRLSQLTLAPANNRDALTAAIVTILDQADDGLPPPQPLPVAFRWRSIAERHLELYAAVLRHRDRR